MIRGVTESEFLERIDQHLARADEHARRGNEIMGDANKIMADSSKIMGDANTIMADSIEIMADHREFIREITVRQERVTDQLVRRLEKGTNELIAGRHVLEDISLATRRHTEALARVLDRLD